MEDMRNNGSPPFGYKRVNGETVPDKQQQRHLAFILSRLAVGWSMHEVAVELNKQGITGPRGGAWTRQYISRILKATPQSED